MAGRIFCAGIYNEGILLFIVKGNTITAQKYTEGMFISDGIITDAYAAAAVVKAFLVECKFNPNSVLIFFKTSKATSRVLDFPYLNNHDLKLLQLHNSNEFFPFPVTDCVIGSAAVYSDAETIMLYTAAVPEEILTAYAEMFRSIKITLKHACVFQELMVRMPNSSNSTIVVVENYNKSNVIIFNSGKPKAIRDLLFSQETFIQDIENIIETYALNNPFEFYLFGSRYEQFTPYFIEKGIVHSKTEILTKALTALSNGKTVNMLPPAHKKKIKIVKALKISAAFMVVIFLSTILAVIAILRTMYITSETIEALNLKVNSEAFIESEAVALALTELTASSEILAADYEPIVTYDHLLSVFSCLPLNVRLTSLSIESDKKTITVKGFAKNDGDLLTLTSAITYNGNFLNIELTDVKREGSQYSFCVSFLYK